LLIVRWLRLRAGWFEISIPSDCSGAATQAMLIRFMLSFLDSLGRL
jgi:hypothetical protein